MGWVVGCNGLLWEVVVDANETIFAMVIWNDAR